MSKSVNSIITYLKIGLLFFVFHFFTWHLLSNFFDAFVSFMFQFGLFSIIYIYLKKEFDYIIFLAPTLILYFITVIAFLDRSITVNLITYFGEQEIILFEDLVTLEKFSTKNIIQKRIDEQVSSGILIDNLTHFELSNVGKFLSKVYLYLKGFYY